MKKFTFILFLLLATVQALFAQIEYVGTTDYGRLKNFVYHPTIENRVYASTLSKHLVMSEDNGKTWEVIHTLPYASYEGFVRDMKLTNKGKALSFVQHYSSGSSLNELVVFDLETNTVIKNYRMPDPQEGRDFGAYSIFDDGTMDKVVMIGKEINEKIYYTTDGGENWNTIFDGEDYHYVMLSDITFAPDDHKKIYVPRYGSYDGPKAETKGGFMYTLDEGNEWKVSLEGLLLDKVAVNPSDANDIYTSSGILWSFPDQHQAVYRSKDGGQTWNELPLEWYDPGGLGNMKLVRKIMHNPKNTDQIIMLEEDQIFVSFDNGETWTANNHEGEHSSRVIDYLDGTSFSINPFNPQEILIDNRWYPLRSLDCGATVTKIKNPYFDAGGILAMVDLPGEQHFYYGVQSGYVHRDLQTNQETEIEVFPPDESPLGGYTHRIDKNIVGRFYSFQGGFMGSTIYVSNDHGLTKYPILSTFDRLMNAAVTEPVNENRVWVSTFNGETAFLRKIDFSNFEDVVVEDIVLPQDNDYINCILFTDPASADKVIITVGNSVYKSADGGTTWSHITQGLDDLELPNIGITMVQNPLNKQQITFSASNGIYTSKDGGESWTRIYDKFVYSVQHSPFNDGYIVAGINTNMDIIPGVVYSSDGGENWKEIKSDKFYESIVWAHTFKFNENNLLDVYFATTDLGVMRYTVDLTPDFCAPVSGLEGSYDAATTTVTLSWKAPEKDNILSYTVLREGKVIEEALAATELSYKDKSITEDKVYNYCVKVNYEGMTCTESETKCVEVTVKTPDICEPVSNLTGDYDVETTTVTLSWAVPEEGTIASYTIKRDGSVIEEALVATAVTYDDKSFTQNKKYDYCVIVNYRDMTCSASDERCTEVTVTGVGIEENYIESIGISPNPAETTFSVVAGDIVDVSSIQVINSFGQVLIETINPSEINISSLTNGIYYVKIELADKETLIKKLIKR